MTDVTQSDRRADVDRSDVDRSDVGHPDVDRPHVAILGAGPVGLDAALAAAEAGLPFTVYERGSGVADHVRQWRHVRLFSPWSMNLSPRMRRALADAGHPAPDGDDCPTGGELLDLALEPLAALPDLKPHLCFDAEVLAVGRAGLLKHEEIASEARAERPFRLLVRQGDGDTVIPTESQHQADLVIDCTGTYGQPNWLGDGGIPAPGERNLDDRLVRHIPDVLGSPEGWAGQTILVAGAGHSASTVLRDLAKLAEEAPETEVLWLLRRKPDWASGSGCGGQGQGDPGCASSDPAPGGEDDPLPARGRLNATARELYAGASPAVRPRIGRVSRLGPAPAGRVEVEWIGPGGERETRTVDRVISLTGYVCDLDLHRQLQVHTCYATEGPMKLSAALLGAGGDAGGGDCLAQESQGVETLMNPEPGFFILGAKSYGRNSAFLMRLGYEQVGEVFAHLSGESG